MSDNHECKALKSCNSISIEKVQGKWFWIFHKKKKTEAHGIKFCPYCGVKLEDLEHIGKTVFLTREEAEAAISEKGR